MSETNASFERLMAVFHEARDQPAGETRFRFLEQACQGDEQLKVEVDLLLQADSSAGQFLEGFQWDATSLLGAEARGQRVGNYQLLEKIGEGGCGVVYLAHQEKPVRRRVALKILKPGMDTRQAIARFEAERQALALMDHPSIAKVYDAGATERGRPYFVMDLVLGTKITQYCDAHKLSTLERLRLFLQVCEAIHHAHQKGVIHRDVKPSNILVAEQHDLPLPKVIDFGIAKAIGQPLSEKTNFTSFEQFVGTPAYMSPEQATLTGVEVDTRSDIYSLGVLLYELLTGQTPFSLGQLLGTGLDEMCRTIREKDPTRPSLKLQTMSPEELKEMAALRQSQPRQLIQRVHGDLDWIVMKCLQKERSRRYETANELAADLRRHLKNEPVRARPDSATYRLGKLVRRNRVAVGLVGVVIVALAAGVAGTITQARRATLHAAAADAQREFAQRQLARVEAINDLNTFLLSDAAPVGKPFTVGELLTRAERLIERKGGESDANRVQIMISIGHQYENQDQHGKARELLSRAYEMSRKLPDPCDRAEAAAALSVSVALAGDTERGEALFQEALAELPTAPEYVTHRVFCLMRGSRVARESGQEKLGLDRALEARRLLHDSGRASPLLHLSVTMEVAESYRMAGRHRDAATIFEQAYDQLVALGRDHTQKAGTLLNNWGLALDALGLPLEAERLYRRAMAISRADADDTSGVSPMLLSNLSRTLCVLHRFTEAAHYAELADGRARQAGDEHVVNMNLNVLATIYREQGNLTRAGDVLVEFERRTAQLLPPGHVAFAVVASQKAHLLLAEGNPEAALTEANRAVALVADLPGMSDRLATILLRRTRIYLELKKLEEAQHDAERVLHLTEVALQLKSPSQWKGQAHLARARALRGLGKADEARAACANALEELRPSLGPEHPDTREAAEGANGVAR